MCVCLLVCVCALLTVILKFQTSRRFNCGGCFKRGISIKSFKIAVVFIQSLLVSIRNRSFNILGDFT